MNEKKQRLKECKIGLGFELPQYYVGPTFSIYIVGFCITG